MLYNRWQTPAVGEGGGGGAEVLPIMAYTLRYMKGVPFFNKRYTKGVPFLSKWYIKGPWDRASHITFFGRNPREANPYRLIRSLYN